MVTIQIQILTFLVPLGIMEQMAHCLSTINLNSYIYFKEFQDTLGNRLNQMNITKY